jgi:hypothetical protein
MGLRDEHGAPRSVPAKAVNPDLTDAAAFAKIFSAQDEAGILLRKAYNVVKNAAYTAGQDASAEAMRELQAIGKRCWPGLTPHHQFARRWKPTSTSQTARTSGRGRRGENP